MDQRQTNRATTDKQTDKEHATPPHATSFPKPPLHASSTSRNHHTVIAISHSCNEQPLSLHPISFLRPLLHASSTSAISTQSACSDHDLVLTQRGYSITSCNFTLEASSLRIIDITQSPLNHFDLALMQGATIKPSHNNLLVTSSSLITDSAQAPHVCTAQPYYPLCNPSQS